MILEASQIEASKYLKKSKHEMAKFKYKKSKIETKVDESVSYRYLLGYSLLIRGLF